MDDRDLVPHGGVVQQVAGGEVVGAVDHQFPVLAQDPVDVLGGQPLLVGDDLDVGVQLLDRPARRLRLGVAELGGGVQYLALEVGRIDPVVVDDPNPADAGRREIERGRRAEPTRADQEDARLEQPLLPSTPTSGIRR